MLRHAFFFPIAILRGLKLVPTVLAKRAFMSYLGGMSREQVLAYGREFAQVSVKPLLMPEMLEIIEEHRKNGDLLILNTASPDFYAHEIAAVLGMNFCIATRMEPDAVLAFWPRVLGQNNKKQVKIERMLNEIPLVKAATSEQLAASSSYSDSKADIPLLEFAGKGFLVHPNEFLRSYGEDKGWKVLKPKLPYANKLGDAWHSLKQIFGAF